VHGLSHGSLFLSSRRTGIYRTDDERDWHRQEWALKHFSYYCVLFRGAMCGFF
jgi:hypothetical protein